MANNEITMKLKQIDEIFAKVNNQRLKILMTNDTESNEFISIHDMDCSYISRDLSYILNSKDGTYLHINKKMIYEIEILEQDRTDIYFKLKNNTRVNIVI